MKMKEKKKTNEVVNDDHKEITQYYRNVFICDDL